MGVQMGVQLLITASRASHPSSGLNDVLLGAKYPKISIEKHPFSSPPFLCCV